MVTARWRAATQGYGHAWPVGLGLDWNGEARRCGDCRVKLRMVWPEGCVGARAVSQRRDR